MRLPMLPFGKMNRLLLAGLAAVLLMYPAQSMAAGEAGIVCIDCHGKLPGKYGEPVKLWQESIHAENGIACNSCHGGDPKDSVNAMSPSRGFLGVPGEREIPAFCGRCHVGVLKDYLSSLHGAALGRGGPTCVTCHGNHRVLKASLDLINEESCSRCHDYAQAAKIKSAMAGTEAMIVKIDAATAGFRQMGIDTERLEKGLFAVRNRFHSLFHTVDVARVGSESALIRTELQKLDKQLDDIDRKLRQRKVAGAFAVSGALLMALLCWLLRRTYDRQ